MKPSNPGNQAQPPQTGGDDITIKRSFDLFVNGRQLSATCPFLRAETILKVLKADPKYYYLIGGHREEYHQRDWVTFWTGSQRARSSYRLAHIPVLAPTTSKTASET